MRVALPFVLMLLALPLAGASGSADETLFELARGDETADPLEVLLAQLWRQDGRAVAMLAANAPPSPPDFVYRDVRPACDLDGDAVPDLIVNNLTLARAPSHAGAASEIEALSGRTGERIWKVDNLVYASMPAPSTVPYTGRGQAFPNVASNAQPVFDLDDDGACDLVAYGFDSATGSAAPFLGDPSITHRPFVLRALSGASGQDIWRQEIDATTTSASDQIFGVYTNVVTRGFPTGVLAFDAPDGPRIALKLTDLRYHMGDSPLGLPDVPTLDPQKTMFKGAPHAEDIRITEHVRLLDARTGELVWQRDLGSESMSAEADTRYTNLTWLSGVAQIGGGAEPDILLDQLVVSTPRTNEANHPATGDTLFRYGRGARVTALDGADGATLWIANLLEPLAAQPNADSEENFETLVWTRSEIVPDIDGDGAADVLATYTAQEESLATTIAGAYRTHFIPLSGTNGTAIWDVRQQGWGIARPLGGGLLGIGMLDVPVPIGEGGQFPPRFVRLLSVEALTGETVWSYERSFAQSSMLSYNLGLSQFVENLAPHDWNADGILDLVTPAQESSRTVRDQVLLATSSHTYGILSGADGHELASVRAWGPDGRVLSCPGDEARLTVLSGHGRRLELARFDAMSGERSWRQVVHNDPTPRAATTAIDVTGLAATCIERGGGTFFSVDLQAYSFERGHEVVPILGVLDDAGGLAWQTPALRGSPPGEALFQASIDDAPPSTLSLWIGAGFAVAFGLVAAFLTLALLARGGSKLLMVGTVLVLLAPSAVSLAMPLATAPSAIAPPAAAVDLALPTVRGTEGAFSLASHVAQARALVLGDDHSNESLSRFNGQDTLSFTHAVGDVDNDGHDDLALDQYCLASDFACDSFISIPEGLTEFLVNKHCGYAHDLVVVSGRNGSLLWSQDMTVYGTYNQCGENFVVGPMMVGEEMALLVYRYQVIWYSGINLDGVALHDFSAISAATGETLWTYSAKGTYFSDFVTSYVAKDYVLVPILQGPPGPDQALFLEGVGWSTAASSTIFPVAPVYPLTDQQVVIYDIHEPLEWAARLDLATGAEMWKRDTFQPQAGINQLPRAMPLNLERSWSTNHHEKGDYYWDTRLCCGDLTGDGVPDLAFNVYEWAQTPMAKVQQPAALDARLVVLDGATGATHLDQYSARDMPKTLADTFNDRYNFVLGIFMGEFVSGVIHEPVGDVDGDGADDLLSHVTVRDPEYQQNMTLVSGKTGEALWSSQTQRDLRALVLGDIDRDGGNDFLLLDWYGHEGAGARTDDDFVTPDAIPLRAVSGRTGERLWQATSFAAPADILESFKSLYRNGVVDVDADGVGDFFADDPIYLDDQTVVHQTSVISGRDGAPLRTMRTVGAFAIPTGAGDLNADGRGEVAILSGDLNDLWLTLYDGASGDASWSRRILALPATGYAQVLPSMKLTGLATPAEDALVVTFHLEIMRSYTYIGGCIGWGCEDEAFGSEQVGTYWETLPQTLRVRSENGALDWALPALDATDGEARTLGATPGAVAFDEIAERSSAVGLLASSGREARPFAIPALGGFILAYALGLAGGIAIVRFRSRFTGVPDLE